MRAAVIENGLVFTIVDVPSLDVFGESVKLVEAPEWVVSGATWDGEVFTNPSPPPPTAEQIVAQYTAAIQKRLDDFARTRDYDGILSAASYATSAVPSSKLKVNTRSRRVTLRGPSSTRCWLRLKQAPARCRLLMSCLLNCRCWHGRTDLHVADVTRLAWVEAQAPEHIRVFTELPPALLSGAQEGINKSEEDVASEPE